MALIDTQNGLLKPFYSQIIVALILLFFGLILGKLLGSLVKKILSELRLDRLVKNLTGINLQVESFISSIVKYFTYFVFAVWALEKIGLGSIVLNLLAGGVILIVIVSFLLGIKDFIPNAVAGIFLHVKGIVREDDWIKTDNIEGRIVKVELVDTQLETKNRDMIFVPNSVLAKSRIIRMNRKD
jgi:small-conductance mechanosensitive channel